MLSAKLNVLKSLNRELMKKSLFASIICCNLIAIAHAEEAISQVTATEAAVVEAAPVEVNMLPPTWTR